MSTLANAVAFISMSTSAYTWVVSRETCPSHARMVLMSTPERSRWTAVVCLMLCGTDVLEGQGRHGLRC